MQGDGIMIVSCQIFERGRKLWFRRPDDAPGAEYHEVVSAQNMPDFRGYRYATGRVFATPHRMFWGSVRRATQVLIQIS